MSLYITYVIVALSSECYSHTVIITIKTTICWLVGHMPLVVGGSMLRTLQSSLSLLIDAYLCVSYGLGWCGTLLLS